MGVLRAYRDESSRTRARPTVQLALAIRSPLAFDIIQSVEYAQIDQVGREAVVGTVRELKCVDLRRQTGSG